MARRARGLVVVAEEHRDEFRALAQYLNDLAEHDREHSVAVWLVEATAVRVNDSAWAPLFTAVVEPNGFTATVEEVKQAETLPTLKEFWDQFESEHTREAAQQVLQRWIDEGHRRRLGRNHVVLQARGPSVGGFRTVIAVYSDGRVMVPFNSYAGENTRIPISPLTSEDFRTRANALFGFSGSELQATTQPGWLNREQVEPLLSFVREVAAAYAEAAASRSSTTTIEPDDATVPSATANSGVVGP